MPQVQVRLVTEADGEQLRELGHRSADGGRIAFRPHYRATLAEAHQVRRPGSTGFVAVAPDGSLVGSAWVTPSPIANRDVTLRLAWFHSLAVDPDWRGRGIAGQLTEARLDHVDRDAVSSLVTATAPGGRLASVLHAPAWLPSTSLSVVLRDHPDVRLADGSLAPWV